MGARIARAVPCVVVAAILGGCQSFDLDAHSVTTADLVQQAVPQATSSQTCVAPGQAVPIDLRKFESRFTAMQAALKTDAGVMTGFIAATFKRAGGVPHDQSKLSLSVADLKSFGEKLHAKILSRSAIGGAAAMPADSTSALASDLADFRTVAVTYIDAYIRGNYVDRYGNKLTAPAISSTVSDAEIAGAVSVLIDAAGDFVLRTPVWLTQDGGKFYYSGAPAPGKAHAAAPGGSGGAGALVPTVATVKLPGGGAWVETPKLVATGACGIDALKADAIRYLAQTAALKASLLGGINFGSVGGFGFALGGFGKFSVGDNQMLATVVRAVLAKVVEHGAAAAAYRVLYALPDDEFHGDLAALLQRYIDQKLTPAKS